MEGLLIEEKAFSQKQGFHLADKMGSTNQAKGTEGFFHKGAVGNNLTSPAVAIKKRPVKAERRMQL